MRKPPVGPLVILALLVGLSVWVVFKEPAPGKAPKEDTRTDDPVLQFSRDAVRSLTIEGAQGEFQIEKGEGGGWILARPFRTAADKEAIEGLITAIESARIERRLGAGGDLKSYGLEPPAATLTVDTGDGAPRVLRLGTAGPIGSTWYAQLPGAGEAAIITSPGGEFSRQDLQTLRDKTLIDLDAWKVRRLVLARPGGSIALEKVEDAWTVKSPVEAPADGPTITDILTALQNLRARSFPAESPKPADLRRFSLEPPLARVTILQDGWDVEKTLQFGKPAGENRYARVVGRDPVLEVPGDVWEKVTTRLFDLRRKEALGLGQYRIQTLTAIRPGQQALTLARQPDGAWSATGLVVGTIKADTMDALLRHLSALKATAFHDTPGEAERALLVRRPAIDLTLAEETPAEGGTPKSQHLMIGPPDRAGKILVRDMAWRPIAVALAGMLENITRQLDAVIEEAKQSPPAPGPQSTPEEASPR